MHFIGIILLQQGQHTSGASLDAESVTGGDHDNSTKHGMLMREEVLCWSQQISA
jgi:hypothetical protein